MSLRKRRLARKMRISDHFILDELTCRCSCGQATIDVGLLRMVENFRRYLNENYRTKDMLAKGLSFKFKVLSGNRCSGYNAREGGSKGSYHLYKERGDGKVHGAMDITVPKMSTRKLHRIAKRLWKSNDIILGGLGLYPWGVHIDSGPYRKWREK